MVSGQKTPVYRSELFVIFPLTDSMYLEYNKIRDPILVVKAPILDPKSSGGHADDLLDFEGGVGRANSMIFGYCLLLNSC